MSPFLLSEEHFLDYQPHSTRIVELELQNAAHCGICSNFYTGVFEVCFRSLVDIGAIPESCKILGRTIDICEVHARDHDFGKESRNFERIDCSYIWTKSCNRLTA